ncbi:unnamed protein product [Rhodiola kirilowii]
MAAASDEPALASVSKSGKRKISAVKKKRVKHEMEFLEQFDSLPWNSSLPNPEAFNITAGTNELDGGFLTLEEIDESEYNFGIPSVEEDGKAAEELSNSKKRKRGDVVETDISGITDAESEGKDEDVPNLKKKSKKKRKKRKPKKKENSVTEETQNDLNITPADHNNEDGDDTLLEDGDETLLEDEEYYAWNELRLHPLILKSIYRLGFKEPTPIQKACIPVAAHQGKDVIGAAETGSGKTLAFGLPILQRLLEEKEKNTKKLDSNGEEAENKYDRRGFLRALIITPTRELALQVTEHLKQVAKDTNTRVVPVVGGMSTEKQERLLKGRPEIVVGTPGRLWELMSKGEPHLVECQLMQLHSLSFFVLDEADRMVQAGHFRELQSIIEMLPGTSNPKDELAENTPNCVTVGNIQQKKRQTFVFSATIALSPDFSKKLKRKSFSSKDPKTDGLNSIEVLSERAGIRPNVAIIDLTSASILAEKIEESFIECREEDKDAYLYYILSVHRQGRTIVFCTSIAALRHISSILSTLKVNVSVLHAQKQQRARLKAMDRFREDGRGILIATDVAARGLDVKDVRTVVHYQLPHSAEVYVHRSGRTGRASADGCSIALISPNDRMKFASLCRSFSKESFRQFPVDLMYMQEVHKRLSLARQIDKISRQESQEKAKKNWFERNAEAVGLDIDGDESDDERANNHKQKKTKSAKLMKLQQELAMLISRPLKPATLRPSYIAAAGVSPLLQDQFEELSKKEPGDSYHPGDSKEGHSLVIGKDCVDAVQALRSSGHEVNMGVKDNAQKRKGVVELRRKRKAEKTRLRDQRRNQKKRLKGKE